MTFSEQIYRVSYYAGVQTVRLMHRIGRFLTLLFLPLRLLFWRIGRSLRRKRSLRIREGLAGVRRRFVLAGQRVKAAWERHPLLGVLQVLYLPIHAVKHYKGAAQLLRHAVAGLAALLVLGGTLYYWSDTTFALALSDDSGEVWGYVADERVLQEGIAMANERLDGVEDAVAVSVSPKVSLQITPQISVWNKAEVCDYLLKQTEVPTETACGLYIDGIFHGAVGSRRIGQRILDEILEESREGNDEVEASFVETVELVEGVYPKDQIVTEKALKEMLAAADEDKTYTVQEKDTWVSVAKKNDTTVSELKMLNPTVEKLMSGQVLTVKKVGSHLRVQVSGVVQYEVEIPYTTLSIPDATMYEGTEKVRIQGQPGVNRITATVTYLNGAEQFSVITASETVEEPITEVISYGTKKKSSTSYNGGPYATGKFIWPTETRFVSQHYGNAGHRGLDIWRDNMTGEEIMAADGGVVVKAGEYPGYSTYGKFVIIDHGNGYRTVYAHCSEVLVQENEIVEQGEVIGLVGNTGRSTAPHLHFEVLINGRTVNPMQYFK